MLLSPIVAHLEHTTEHGGAELALRRLLGHSEGRWTARLLLSGRDPDLGAFSGLPPGVEVIRSGITHPPGASQVGALGSLVALARAFREGWHWRRALREVDVVHANTSRSALIGAIAVLGSRKPFLVHLRDRVDAASLGKFGYLAFRLLVSRRATAFVANSASTAQSVRNLAGRRDVHVLASPIGIPKALSVRPVSVGSAPRIGMVARLDSWKGQDLLISAFARSGIDGSASLHFYGDASFGKQDYAEDLQLLVARLGLQHVSFEGYVDDVQAAVDGLDICVQYSTRPEPLGQNVLQYLARGRATVVADEGGPTEWVEDGVNGLRVAPRDVEALADALRRLIESPDLRQRMGEAALRTPGLPTDENAASAHSEVFRRAVG